MKNNTLKAMRTRYVAGCDPEFADNCLAVNLSFCHTLPDTREFVVSVYARGARLMASAVISASRGLNVCRRMFRLRSASCWDAGAYCAVVSRNGIPSWTARFVLDERFDALSRTVLTPLDMRSSELIMSGGSGLDEWWRENWGGDPDLMAEAATEPDEFDLRLEQFINGCKAEAAAEEAASEAERPEDWECEMTAEQELQQMVGLSRLKEEIADARLMALFDKERREAGLDSKGANRHHMLFLGNPGTGKTTVARLVGRMYHEMGLLSSGHTVETSRAGLVGEYIGQTEQRTQEVISKARGGVLFIDEAYTLVQTTDSESRDFGKEVVNALLTVLSEPDPDMIVILAGYADKMQTLFRYNPGIKDRFPLCFHFDDYSAVELLEIARRLCRSRNFSLTPEADARLAALISSASTQRDANFGNGRWVHNLIDHGVVKSMARRVMSAPHQKADVRLLSVIEDCDVTSAGLIMRRLWSETATRPMHRIGFVA